MLSWRSATETCTWKRFIVISFTGCGWSAADRGASGAASAAAVVGEKATEAVHFLEIGGIDQRRPSRRHAANPACFSWDR